MSKTLTKKQIVKEIVKCGKEPVYFINNYCKISHPQRGLIPFTLYDYQAGLLEDFNDYRFNVILKARQLGISTVTAAYIVWLMLFYRDKNVLVVATKFGTAANLVKKVKSIMLSLPPWLKIASIKIDNRTSFILTNGSEVKASTTSADAGRSEALSLLVIDEAAHVDGLGDLWTGLYPTLSTGGRCISLSTPNGVGNWFHKVYIEADQGANDFHPTMLTWDVHPERDQAWYEKETRNMSQRQIAQELECSFNASGDTVIHPEDLKRIHESIKPPVYKTGFDRNLWLWEQYDSNYNYLMVADVARGDGSDFSVFHIIKLETMEVIGEYQGKPSLGDFSRILYNTGKEFGFCLLVVENNSLGISVLEKLQELDYSNLYYSAKGTHEYVDAVQAYDSDKFVPGFTTSSKTRPLIVAKMEEFIRNKLIKIYSSRIINEFKTFIWHNNRPQAMRSYHDDLVMSFAIACWVKDTALTVNQRELDYKRAMVNSMFTQNSSFQTTIAGMEGHEAKGFSEETLNRKEEYEQYIWLLKG
tara:strand:+ start:1133 stop:2719 length:1587 start_codon:yes stop_codon:yes gene_type:complete